MRTTPGGGRQRTRDKSRVQQPKEGPTGGFKSRIKPTRHTRRTRTAEGSHAACDKNRARQPRVGPTRRFKTLDFINSGVGFAKPNPDAVTRGVISVRHPRSEHLNELTSLSEWIVHSCTLNRASRVHRREPRAHCHSAPRRWRYVCANPGRTNEVPRVATKNARSPGALSQCPAPPLTWARLPNVRTAVRSPSTRDSSHLRDGRRLQPTLRG